MLDTSFVQMNFKIWNVKYVMIYYIFIIMHTTIYQLKFRSPWFIKWKFQKHHINMILSCIYKTFPHFFGPLIWYMYTHEIPTAAIIVVFHFITWGIFTQQLVREDAWIHDTFPNFMNARRKILEYVWKHTGCCAG